MEVNIYFLISLKLIIVCNAQTWSTWTSCSYLETCQNKIELICDNGRGIQCSQYGSATIQITLSVGCIGSCDGFDNKQWKTVYNLYSCQGNCYDSINTNEGTCKTNLACKRYRYIRCYNETTCRGIWKETSSQCSSSCGGGTRSVSRSCVNQTTGQEPIYCNGTFFGKYTQINISQHICNTHACPTSTPGNKPTSCSTFCGNATQTSTSTNFPIEYVVVGCGGLVLLVIIAIIVYVVMKKSTAKKKTLQNLGDTYAVVNENNFVDIYEKVDVNADLKDESCYEYVENNNVGNSPGVVGQTCYENIVTSLSDFSATIENETL